MIDVDFPALEYEDGNPEDISTHAIKQKAATAAWEKIRPTLLTVAVENSAMPSEQNCINCAISHATCRCVRCGPWVYYCHDCYVLAHSKVNLFHTGEVWEVRVQIIKGCGHSNWPCTNNCDRSQNFGLPKKRLDRLTAPILQHWFLDFG